MRGVEAILFDLDGTLVDSSAGIEHSARHAVSRVLPGVMLPSLRPFIGPPVRDVFRLALKDVPGLWLEETLDRLEMYFREDYDTHGWRLSTAYPAALSNLSALANHGVRCFVVTNKPKLSARRILDHLGMSDWLEQTVCRDSCRPSFASKSAAVRHLLLEAGLDPQATLFVGDSTDDATAAFQNGLRFVAASYGYGQAHFHQDGAAATMDSMTELLPLLDQLSEVETLQWAYGALTN